MRANIAHLFVVGSFFILPTAAFLAQLSQQTNIRPWTTTCNNLLNSPALLRKNNIYLPSKPPTPPLSTALNMLFLADAATDPTSASFFQNRDVWVFIAGVFPFAWATVEFWRRIAVGESFGTGSDAIVISIGTDDAPADSRGRRVLGKGALVTACILFALAFGTIGLVLYSVATSSAPPDVLPTMVDASSR